MKTVALTSHPASPSQPDCSLEVEVQRQGPLLTLAYRVKGGLHQIRLPSPSQPKRQDKLWQHSCFEAFLQTPGSESYEEYNFSPSGCWAHYRFSGYRQALPEPQAQAPAIHCAWQDDELLLSTCIELLNDSPISLGLSAILEDQQGKLSYWAVQHPSEQPDFHNAAGFSVKS